MANSGPTLASQESADGSGPRRESPVAARTARIYLIASATFVILGIGFAAGLSAGIQIGGHAVANAVMRQFPCGCAR